MLWKATWVLLGKRPLIWVLLPVITGIGGKLSLTTGDMVVFLREIIEIRDFRLFGLETL